MIKEKGFTLIELMVIVVIIAIIFSVGMGNYFRAIEKTRESVVTQALKTIQISLEMYATENEGNYPIANGLNELREKIKKFLPGGNLPVNPYNDQPYSDENNSHYKITYTYDPLENAYTLTVWDRYNIKRLILLSNKIVIKGGN